MTTIRHTESELRAPITCGKAQNTEYFPCVVSCLIPHALRTNKHDIVVLVLQRNKLKFMKAKAMNESGPNPESSQPNLAPMSKMEAMS